MLARKALAGTAGAPKVYVEDVFSTYLYTGNDSTQTITNNIDISTEGGLVWIKGRNTAYSHILADTNRGTGKFLSSNTTDAQGTDAQDVTAFNSTGFTVGNNGRVNNPSTNFTSWTFRKAKKFFDVVTYTGTGTTMTVSHNLGSVPGCMIVKGLNSASAWDVYHRANTANPETEVLRLSTTDATSDQPIWNDTLPTATEFTVAGGETANVNGRTYVAYLFAHDAGGFGDAGSDSIIKCGSYTGNGAAGNAITLDWEPQWLLIKQTNSTGSWALIDNMRGFPVGSSDAWLYANLSNAESNVTSFSPTATGFVSEGSTLNTNAATYIYIAIRRGPMKTPTSGTSVYNNSTRSATAPAWNSGFPVDWFFQRTTGADNWAVLSRLTGSDQLRFNTTDAATSATEFKFDFMNGVNGSLYSDSTDYGWMMRRAPGFFDVVCYTGTGSATTFSHNLGVAPELMIVKRRDSSGFEWDVWCSAFSAPTTNYLWLNSTAAIASSSSEFGASPTSSVFSVGTASRTNASGGTYVAYLFASLTGISKVGSYTGNGSNQTINCGFTGGARFVLIKATSTTGNWVVFDSARGIVSGDDPYLLLNSTAAEVTNKDAVDTDSTGFVVNETTGPNVNTNGVSYIFWAVA